MAGSIIGTIMGSINFCLSLIEGCLPFGLPGMSPAILQGAALEGSAYGVDWFKSLGKVFKNFFDLNFF